jgi:hypothetical protein
VVCVKVRQEVNKMEQLIFELIKTICALLFVGFWTWFLFFYEHKSKESKEE